ncbi:GrpB family protein [Dactylosporangium sp. NPDC051485]|uniref:GrpB family protein n=1 Tax=Dactylosporangium sp. NPDC051485 TaxID=3154846 RepID=UPI003444B6D3
MIEILEYDSAWPALAAREIGELRAALAGRIADVEHVGSTAVPGLAAKPVIDLMAAADDLDAVAHHEDVLGSMGYARIETGMPERLFYRREGTPVAYHLHVVPAPTWATRNERLLRDHLLATPADRDAYARLKHELAGTTGDGLEYTRGKTALIQRMVDEARAARGLQPVDVWEE